MTTARPICRLAVAAVVVSLLVAISASAPAQQPAEVDEALLLLLAARNAWKAGDLELAQRRYERFLREYPDHWEARTEYGWVLLEAERREEALAQFEAVARATPEDVGALRRHARILLTLRRVQAADAAIRGVRRQHPDDLESQLLAAELAMLTRRYGDARTIYQRLVDTPVEREARRGLADAATALGEHQAARAIVTDLRQRFPDEPRIAERLALSFGLEGRWLEAYRAFEDIDDPGRRARVEAEFLKFQGRHFGAEERFRELLRRAPRDYALRMGLAEAIAGQEDFERAAAVYEDVLRDYPDDVEGRLALAEAALAQGEDDDALRAVREILNHDPDHPYAQVLLARVHRLRDEPAAADEILTRLAASVPTVPEARALQVFIARQRDLAGLAVFSRGLLTRSVFDGSVIVRAVDALVATGRTNEAQAIIADLARRHPGDPVLVAQLAELHRLQSDRRAARRLLEQAPAHVEVADVHYRLGAFRASAEVASSLVRADPQDLRAFVRLVRGLAASKDLEAALRTAVETLGAAPPSAQPALVLALARVPDGRSTYYDLVAEMQETFIPADPPDIDLTVARLELTERRQEIGEAISGYRSLIARHPGRPLLQLRLARLLAQRRDQPAAAGAYDEYLGMKPYDLRAWREKARAYDAAFERDLARAEYRQLLERHPTDQEARLEQQAREAFWRERYRFAHDRYFRLLEREPDNDDALYTLGQLSSLGLRPREAQAWYRRLLVQTPGHRDAALALALSEQSERPRLTLTGAYVDQRGFEDQRLITYWSAGVEGETVLLGALTAGAGYQHVEFDVPGRPLSADIGRVRLRYALSRALHVDGFLAVLRYPEIDRDTVNGGAGVSYVWPRGTRTRLEYSRQDLWENQQTVRSTIQVNRVAAALTHPLTERLTVDAAADYGDYSDGNHRVNGEFAASYKLSLFPRILRVIYQLSGLGFRRESVYFSPDHFIRNTAAIEFRHFLGYPDRGQYFAEAPLNVYSLYYGISVDNDQRVYHEGAATLAYGLTRSVSLGGTARIIRSTVFREVNVGVFLRYTF